MLPIRTRRKFAPALVLSAPVLFLFAVILLITPATAQKIKQLPPPPPGPRYKPKPTPTPEYEVVRISSNLVVVPVSVTDAQGQPVLGLKQSEFHLEEDGRAQEITQLGDPEQVPLDIALLIDVSSSVSERFAFEEQADAGDKNDGIEQSAHARLPDAMLDGEACPDVYPLIALTRLRGICSTTSLTISCKKPRKSAAWSNAWPTSWS